MEQDDLREHLAGAKKLVDFVTPQKLAVIALLQVYCEFSVRSEHRCRVLRTIMNYICPTSLSLMFKDLGEIQKDFKGCQDHAGRDFFAVYMAHLAEIEEIEDMHFYFEGLNVDFFKPDDGSPPLVSPNSLIGSFLRRCYLEYQEMTFEDRQVLWEGFLRLQKRQVKSLAKNIEAFSRRLEGTNVGGTVATEDSGSLLAVDDMMRIFECLMQYMHEHGTHLSFSMLETLEYAIYSTGKRPSAIYYVKFLHAWRIGDYRQANEYIRSYFDFANIKDQKARHQYALLNLAMMQAEFGCHDEAVGAIQEAIRTAREFRDTPCLNFCLSWVTMMQAELPLLYSSIATDDENTSNYLKAKTQECGMVDLHSSVYLADMRTLMAEGASPVEVIEAVEKSMLILSTVCMPPAIETLYSTKAALWARLGIEPLSMFYEEAGAKIFDSSKIFSESVIKARLRKAYGDTLRGDHRDALDTYAALRDVACMSRWTKARWLMFTQLTNLRIAVRQQWISEANHFFQLLQKTELSDSDVTLELSMVFTEYYMLTENTELAVSEITRNLESAIFKSADLHTQLRYQIAYAELMCKIGHHYRGYSLMMRVVAVAERNCILPCMVSAILVLCMIFISSRQFDSVLAIMDTVFPFAIMGKDYDSLARAFHLTFVAMVGANDLCAEKLARSSGKQREDMLQKLAHSVKYAHCAFLLYNGHGRVELANEVSASLALLSDLLGENYKSERDKYVSEFFSSLPELKPVTANLETSVFYDERHKRI
ncbi:anaphase-promoting complex subunit 5-domain-containing protein [Myxozyma melibiosi]|uniref:Anaphase-promoting complex subunit 5 n=1 Tax=Myxozyma melibiosi TaxID=54550 RepID=A0ABR1F5J9_9ASCO